MGSWISESPNIRIPRWRGSSSEARSMSEIDTAERRISQLLGENPALRLLLGLLAAAIAAYLLIVRFRVWIPPELLSVALAIGPWLVILAVIGFLVWLAVKVYV